jgi:hypothetical protein
MARLSSEELMEMAAASARSLASAAGLIALAAAELDRREAWRDEGATSVETWLVGRLGVSAATARAWSHVGSRLFDLPQLAMSLARGSLSFDKVRAVADAATPSTDASLCEEARDASVRDLAELARRTVAEREARAAARAARMARDEGEAPPGAAAVPTAPQCGSVRFNDTCRTMTAQLAPEVYAEVRSRVEAEAKAVPTDGETPWDTRQCLGLLALVRSGGEGSAPVRAPSPHLVVAHVPLADLVDESGEPTSLCAELEHDGLISLAVAQRLACEGAVVVAIDDDVGRTMYEGRARRVPNEAQRREIWRRDRHCRFPSCESLTFTHVHHFPPWLPDGRTDLDCLVTLCEHHHHLMHSNGWTVSGDANGELIFVGPTGRVDRSRPSLLWTSVTGRRQAADQSGRASVARGDLLT